VAALSSGAVELPMHHVSVRVPWHDTNWTGQVCAAPRTNQACAVLNRIKKEKDPDSLARIAETPFAELLAEEKKLPPCVLERVGFMRSHPLSIKRTHAYAGNDAYSHFAETTQRMAPHSLEVIPFRWMRKDGYERASKPWGINVHLGLEDEVNSRLPFESAYMQDHRNQLALLDSFFSALRPGKSLVLLYVKDLPLVEQPEPGTRYLVGAGFVDGVEPVVEWEYDGLKPGDVRSVMWERGVAHSIRDDARNGFLLPYQRLLAEAPPGLDLAPFVARAPGEHFDEFSYGSELVTQDGTIAALTELARVVDLLGEVADGPWDAVGTWIGERLADAWHARGPYPGMGPLLAAAGLERGPVLARRVLDNLPAGVTNPWPELERVIAQDRYGLVGRKARKAWEHLTADADAYRQLRVMSRFGLTVDQARHLFDGLEPAEVLDNPYCLYESDLDTTLAFTTIDRGLWPQDADARAALEQDAIDDPVTEAEDDRRVRAASKHVLERAAEQGHTLLDEAGVRKRLAALEIEPRCDPGNTDWKIAAEEFDPLLVERELAKEAGRGWQLYWLAEVSERIAADVRERLEGPPLDVTWKWADRIDDVLPDIAEPDEAERDARAEKAAALEVIVRSRISALVGPAGTGKTSMLEALCDDDELAARGIQLLAPTGKAAVQLALRTGKPAETLAQFLRRHHRWDMEGGYYLADKPRYQGAETVVIDEASMLTEEMLAATIDALAGVERLILCGDPRQLPPIGAGRPFADLVALLRDEPGTSGGVAELHTGRRQSQAGAAHATTPDDVAVASLFSIDGAAMGADEALARVLSGQGDGRIKIVSWSDEADLHDKVVELLGREVGNGLESLTREGLWRALGASCHDGDLPDFDWGRAGKHADDWQLLSPVRARQGGVLGLNDLVRRTWRPTDVRWATRSYGFTSPGGADRVIFADKVMCLRNDHRREGYDPINRKEIDGSVANGEIGLIVKAAGRKPPFGHTVEFSSQPGRQYTFTLKQLNGDSESRGEWLELAYAVTVHKSQGSQFRVTFVVIPDPCFLLSPELLYTALTRQQDKVVLLKQGDPTTLRDLASPARSVTARRLTCLFRPADPFAIGDGPVLDGRHVHRTVRGDDLVRSKSEVIVADALHALKQPYRYEAPLVFPGELPRHPDFTISRPGKPPVYWEHLGRLDLAGYRADWEARKAWYASHDILPWEDGGGARGALVCSDENVSAAGIDSNAVRALARKVFQLSD
jgi:hypothetical protein